MAGRSSTRFSLARFGISAILGGALTYGLAGLVVGGTADPPVASPSPGATVDVDPAVGFVAIPRPGETPAPLGPPPGDQLIQLVSFGKDAPPPVGLRPAWWTPAGIPRVDHITQFDGGRLQGANSVMAAGAMLARLGYGIVTTGSQLRSLVPSGGGTSLRDLELALETGWNADLRLGQITGADLRAILSAGGGIVILVTYGAIPAEQQVQPEFSGGHALYLDGFHAGSSASDDTYYVMDPMGPPTDGFAGDWWPADIVDRAALDFGDGTIAAAWAFAGGIVPHGDYPPLPPSSFPIDDQDPPPFGLDTRIGIPGPEPPDISNDTGHDARQGGLDLLVDLGACLVSPAPPVCPPGVPAVYPSPKVQSPTAPPLVGTVPLDLLYADTPQPGIARVIFAGPADIDPAFSYWPADGSGPALRALPVAVTLGGKQVWMVTIPIPEAAKGAYDFVASTNQGGVVSASEVGQISFGN